MSVFHAVNAALNGHLLVFWAMALNAVLYFQRGGGLALIGLLCGAVALTLAHICSSMDYHGIPRREGAYIVSAIATALAWAFFILAASL